MHSPGALKEYASLAIGSLSYLSLAYMMIGPTLITLVGLDEPPFLREQREAKWPLAVAFFLGNQVAGGLKSTGAYEVVLNGELIYSKLATGQVPNTAELAHKIMQATGLKPDENVAAQFGFR